MKQHLLILGCKDFPPFSTKKIISGGMEIYTYELVIRLLKMMKITLICGGNKISTSQIENLNLIKVNIFGKWFLQPITLTFFSFFKTFSVIRKITVVNPQTPLSGLIAFLIKLIFKKPYVLTVHIISREYTGNVIYAYIYSLIERISLRYADAIIVVGNSLKEYLIKRYKIPPKKIHFIHAGADMEDISVDDDYFNSLKISKNDFIVLFLGRLINGNGIFDLIDAVKLLKEKNIKLLIAGNGDLEKDILKKIKDENLDREILYMGIITGNIKKQIIKRANIFVRTSYREVFPVAYLEALSLGTPVIATPVGDVPYIAKESKAITLVPVKSSKILAEKIGELRDNPSLIEEMRKNAYQYVSRISWETQTQKYYNVIQKITK